MKRQLRKNLALLLSLAMLFTFFPTAASAAGENGVYTQVTELDALTSGQYVLVADTSSGAKALGTNIGSKIDGTDVTITADGLSSSSSIPSWTVTVSDGAATFYNGSDYLGYGTSGTNFTKPDTAYDWNVTSNPDGTFRFTASSAGTRAIAWQDQGGRFGAYATSNTSGYVFDLLVFKAVGEGGTTEPGGDPEPQPSVSPIADGDQVVIYNPTYNKALSTTYIGFYNSGVDVSLSGDTLSGYTDAEVWTVIDNGDGTWSFSYGGQKLGMDTDFTSMPLGGVNDKWVLEDAGNGLWYIKNTVREAYIEWYDSNSNWSAYYNINAGSESLFAQAFYKVSGDTPDPEEPETISIADALAAADGTENLTVKGVVTLLDGKNVYLQDSTGGICVRMSNNFDDIALGDTIIGTGKRATFNGLPQLDSSTYVKSSGLTLTPAVKTIGELTTADICTYVTLRNVEVTEVYDNNGQFSSPNITVKDSAGSTIQLYKAVVGEKNEDGTWPVAVGSVITITAAVSVYNSTLQLRNTNASEIDLDGSTTSGPIAHGDKVVIYAPAYGMALSGTYNGFYNNGTAVTLKDGILSGFTAADVWTVADNGDDTWSFSYDGKNIGMGDSFSSMPLGEKNDKWVLEDAGNGLWYIKNTVRNSYMEWYAEKNNWSSYGKISAGSEGMFALAFYKVTEMPEEPSGDLPEAGAQVVLYNEGAKGVLAGGDGNETSPSINNAAATVTDGAATPANGARVFTVEVNGEWFRFRTADGYLCSNGTGNNAFYSAEATEDADWKLTAFNGGFNMESRTAKFNGKYSQYLEYYGGSYKTYSLYNDSDKDIYTFNFYPVAEGVTVTDSVVNMPAVTFGTLPDAYVGQAYTVSFTVDAVFGVKDVSAKYGSTTAELTNDNGTWSFTIPAAAMTAGELEITVTGTDSKDVSFTGSTTLEVKDEPYITSVFPAASAQTGDEKQPEIGFTFGNAGENPTIAMTVNDASVDLTVADGKASYTPAEAMADGKVTVTATVSRTDGKSVSRTWSFTIGVAQFQLYFGQLHSHTAEYSDGAGTLQEGLNYVANLPEDANVDFVAFTDHSNYFDASGAANPEAALYDVSQMTEASAEKWSAYTGAVADFNAAHKGKLVALAGFEMTWSGGPGHINTFNTPGIVSRNNATLNNKTGDAGMKAYYALLSNSALTASISQFNHPGSTFGTFSDFAYYDPVIDTRMYLVEVGNGEGAIGAGGYYPSYEYYIMALDKGWHVAPTNNQDNHKGKWGNANDARDVILTDDFSQEGIYEAIRNYRVYATEDKNLEINYTLNGQMMGSIIEEVPENVTINVSLYDPDTSDTTTKVEVVVNSGSVAYTWDNPTELASGELECTIPASYSYYFIRVTQGDGNLAVTAPVWVGETLKLGISSVECGTSTPVTSEALTLTTTLFNSESDPATVKSLTYSVGDQVLGTDTKGYELPASGTLTVDWSYIPDMARVMTITVTVLLEKGGIEYTYSKDVTLDILDASQLVYIGIDASHYNEYVNGNYKDSMGNFGNLAAGYSVRTVELKTSEDLIAACENKDNKYVAMILTAPSRRLVDAQNDPRTYSDAELEALAAFNAAGGTVIVAGWSDYYENYPVITGNPDIVHMAATQNAILEALGSSLRIADDTASDDTLNGGDSNRRLYLSTYNWDNFLMDGVEFDPEYPNNNLYSQLYSHYGGATVYAVDVDGNATSDLPATVSPVVYGHATTYSKDNDNDGLGGSSVPEYAVAEGDDRLMVLATEDLGGDKGLIVVSGAAFMSNFEVQATIGDSGSEKNYSNYNICENLVSYLNPLTITDIADVQAQPLEGIKYVIEGVVTSNASGYDKDTAFFDCIYVQDDTAGINAFPVAGNYKIGDKVRITGTTSSYQGERQISVTSIEKIGEGTVEPKLITTQEAAQSKYLGSLVQIKGVVVSFAEAEGLVQTIMVRDETGYDARVFIDGYITSSKAIENLAVGHEITVTGLASYDNTFDGPAPRIRIRDRVDIVCGTEVVDIPPEHVEYYPPYTPPTQDDDVVIIDENGVPLTPVPPADAGAYTVAVQVDKDGHYTIVPIAVVENGKILSLGDSSMLQLIDNTKVFVDVAASLWYSPAVAFVSARELLLGTGGGYFAPNATVTGGELVTVLWRLAGCPAVEGQVGTQWYAEAAQWAASLSIVSDGFDGSQTASRADVAKALYAMAGVLEADTTLTGSLNFTDAASIPEDAMDAFLYCQQSGIITGRPGGLAAPGASLTRGELSAMVQRFILALLK